MKLLDVERQDQHIVGAGVHRVGEADDDDLRANVVEIGRVTETGPRSGLELYSGRWSL